MRDPYEHHGNDLRAVVPMDASVVKVVTLAECSYDESRNVYVFCHDGPDLLFQRGDLPKLLAVIREALEGA